MSTCVDSFFQNQRVALQGYPLSPILRPCCPFQGISSHNPGGTIFSADQALQYTRQEGCLSPLYPRKYAYKYAYQMRPGRGTATMENSFEARLGLQAQASQLERADEIYTDGEVEAHGEEVSRNAVLVVMDANKEISLNALDWALTSVVQKGDSVKLLGILHHIMNPMGYKSRADEKSWNGANRKILNSQIEAHLAIYRSIPDIYSRVERFGAKLEIDVQANPLAKFIVVEEARKLDARYVVIDRHIKKDKKFYIENLNCFVTRVKTMTKFEHLRHGVPDSDLEGETLDTSNTTTEVPDVPSEVPLQESASPTSQHTQAQPQALLQFQHPLQPPTPTSMVMSGVRPGDFFYDDSLTFEGAMPRGIIYGPELMGNAYESQMGVNMTGEVRELAVHRWLAESGSRVDLASDYGASDLGHVIGGYPEEEQLQGISTPLSPTTEAALADHMSNLYHQNPYGSLPPLSRMKQKADFVAGPCTLPSAHLDSHRASSILRHSQSVPKASEYATEVPNNPGVSDSGAAELQVILDGGLETSSSVPVPISVQPRRVDSSWTFDLLNSDLGKHPLQPVEKPNLAKLVAKKQLQTQLVDVRSSPPRDYTQGLLPKSAQGLLGRMSSVRRAVSSKKQTSGAPPLCSWCQQKSPDFGKVKRFTFLELQEATNNFSMENYLAEGGYGSVYKGRLKEGQLVAVKQHSLASSQGDEEFCAEVEVLSCAQHRNLVTLVGYCVENHLRLLVYEYVCNGSLDRHLSPKSKTDLKWKYRQKIALGAARALRYLHEECRVGCIVHRDMRPNNILLTHDFTPMVGDFGLARRQVNGDEAEETRVLGTIGYLAPEYAETGKITDKADVYAFGVVLLELITGRKSIDYKQARNQVSLTEWARPLLECYDKNLVDPRLKMEYDEYELHCMMHAANQCVKKDPTLRPRMTQVLRILNPPQERDWAYGQGRWVQEVPSSFSGPYHPTANIGQPHDFFSFVPTPEQYVSSSAGSSCSQSDLSVASLSDTNSLSDSESLSQQPQSCLKIPRPKSSNISLWKLNKTKVLQNEAMKEQKLSLSYDGMV